MWHAAAVSKGPSSNLTSMKNGSSPGLGELPKFGASPLLFLEQLQLATSNLVHSLGWPRHVIKSHREKSMGGLGLGELPKTVGFPYNVSVTAGASDFKFGAQLGFAKVQHKITRRRKGGNGNGLGKLPKIWGSPSIFTQWLQMGDFYEKSILQWKILNFGRL